MRSFLMKKLPRGRPRRGRRNDKVLDITKAGTRLLAGNDFDAWSMAKLAHEAGCSVGTLYARFSDKYGCLQYLIDANFRVLANAANAALSPTLLGQLSPTQRAGLWVNHVVSEMTSPSAAGIIRATIKLATFRPDAIQKFEEYRKTVSNCAVEMLRGHLHKDVSPETARVAAQVVVGTITDAIMLQKPGPMTSGSRRMKAALTNIFCGYLGISEKRKWSGKEATDDEGRVDNKIFDEPPTSGPSQYDPKEQGFRRTKATNLSKPSKSQAVAQERRSPTRTPPKVPKSARPAPPKRSRRKPRVI
jgi:AcrR family transcriptional regulator